MAIWEEMRAAARKDAEEVLEEYWNGVIPVDPIAIAEAMGISSYRMQLGDNVSGMLRKRPQEPAEIFVDLDDGPLRSRFTIAHELGHFMDRIWGNDAADEELIDRRDGTSNPTEFRANEFAGSLLMPEKPFVAMVREGVSDFKIARAFQVSQAAVRVRKETLGCQ